jgi:hypothetical protein
MGRCRCVAVGLVWVFVWLCGLIAVICLEWVAGLAPCCRDPCSAWCSSGWSRAPVVGAGGAAESAAAPPLIKGLGAFLRSLEVMLLPPWPAVGGEVGSLRRRGVLCFLRLAMVAREKARCRVRPLPKLVQVGGVLCVMLL